MDNLEALNPLDLNLFRTSLEFLLTKRGLYHSFRKYFHIILYLTAVTQEVNSLDSSVVVHELEFAMRHVL